MRYTSRMNTPSLDTYVALLRGVNVGGKGLVKMAELVTCFETAGYRNVSTYINSGNIIFQTPASDRRTLEDHLEKVLRKTFGWPLRVQVRSLSDINKLMKQLPASWASSTPQKCNVIFLDRTIDRASILHELHPKPEIEELHYAPGVLLWSAPLTTLTKSNMIKLSLSPLYQHMTIRIVGTVRKVHDLMHQKANLA